MIEMSLGAFQMDLRWKDLEGTEHSWIQQGTVIVVSIIEQQQLGGSWGKSLIKMSMHA